jgi:hypothetical protein
MKEFILSCYAGKQFFNSVKEFILLHFDILPQNDLNCTQEIRAEKNEKNKV